MKQPSRFYPTRIPALSTINPLAKMLVCLGSILLALFLQHPESTAILVVVFLVLIRWQLGFHLKSWLYGAIASLLFLAFSTLLLGDFQEALASTLRILAIALPTPLLAGTTPPMDLIRALQTLRLPGSLILSLMLIWRFLPIIQQEAQRILEANRLRGVELVRQPTYWFSGLFLPLIFQMVAYADEVTIGLQTRGYDPAAPRSNSQPLRWTGKDTQFSVGAIALLTGVSYLEWQMRSGNSIL